MKRIWCDFIKKYGIMKKNPSKNFWYPNEEQQFQKQLEQTRIRMDCLRDQCNNK